MWMDYLLQSASISKVECGLGGETMIVKLAMRKYQRKDDGRMRTQSCFAKIPIYNPLGLE